MTAPLTVSAVVTGGDAVVAALRAQPQKARAALTRAITRETIALAAVVKSEKLSGQVLKNRTGRLRRSINTRVEDSRAGVTGSVGTNVVYGRVHEFGGTFTIPAHQRMISMVFGRPVAPHPISVRSYAMHVPERSFLRSALTERAPAIRAAMDAAVAEGLR